jgi:hypothetical protein
MRLMRTAGMALVALALGLAIGLVDTSPGWDDAGITAGAILIVGALFGAVDPARAWLWALALGIWIPALNIAMHHNYGSLLVLAFAFGGAYAGALARKVLVRSGGSA